MKIFIVLFLVLSLTSCSHYYYAPNAANVPLFKEKNTFKLRGGYSADSYDGADIQMAYSVSKKIGVMVNSFFASESENVQDNYSSLAAHAESGKGSYIEAGLGYYKAFGNHKVWIFETYGGAGVGGESHIYNYSEASNLGLSKYFIQPSFGYSAKREHFEFALSSRFSRLNLKIKNNNLSSQTNQSEKQNLGLISSHPSSLLWEPSILIASGGKYIKFYLQLTISNNLSNPYLPMDNSNISLGIKITFKNDQKKANADKN